METCVDNEIKEIIDSLFPEYSIQSIERIGGMTNRNYLVCVNNKRWVIRVAGQGTKSLINRHHEFDNTHFAKSIGIHPNIVHLDAESGIKITEFVEGARSATVSDISVQSTLEQIVKTLHRIHNSSQAMHNSFMYTDVLSKYESLVDWNTITMDLSFFYKAREILATQANQLSFKIVPCHNDLVPENWLIKEDSIYLLDWEYAGSNDPCWDLASLITEWGLSKELRTLFLDTYCNGEHSMHITDEKIDFFICAQDLLWFVWSLIKIQSGVDYTEYAMNRLSSLERNIDIGKSKYGW